MSRKRNCLGLALILFALTLLALLAILARPAYHLWTTSRNDNPTLPPSARGTLSDASRLNATTVSQILTVPPDPHAAEEQLRQLLARANNEKLRVTIAGARHSMGGHTLYPGGIAINMLPFNGMSLTETSGILHVGSGALWSDIIPYLNRYGKSIGVMQSNNSFSVGGSLSVNCHGWQTGKPPIASTVESFRLMKPDGTITTCSRTTERELFSLALGGYGLFGIILDADLRVVPNEMLRLQQITTTPAGYAAAVEMYARHTSGSVLAYGRLQVTPSTRFDTALLNVWQKDPTHSPTTSTLASIEVPSIVRTIFRGSVGKDYGKELRWFAEDRIEPLVGLRSASRNTLLNFPADWFENHSPADTDILHEYFVPPAKFEEFLAAAKAIIEKHNADLLNVTVRDIEADHDTFLRYADHPMLCLVMLFNHKLSPAGDSAMEKCTQDLIDTALSCGGRYYLPYRLHATQKQIRQAYPMLDDFLSLKRKYDPNEIFQNEFYRKYTTKL